MVIQISGTLKSVNIRGQLKMDKTPSKYPFVTVNVPDQQNPNPESL